MPDLFELLVADGPHEGPEANRRLYAPLIGSWEVDSTWHRPDGSKRTATGEWHFKWVLGGLGIQDLLFEKGAPAHRYGATLRCYDAAVDAWRVTWMAPAAFEYVSLVGRQVGDRIVQQGHAMDGSSLERWTFSQLTHEGFLWQAESSRDQGETWRLDQEMSGSRLP